jgi:hypothetical protein
VPLAQGGMIFGGLRVIPSKKASTGCFGLISLTGIFSKTQILSKNIEKTLDKPCRLWYTI